MQNLTLRVNPGWAAEVFCRLFRQNWGGGRESGFIDGKAVVVSTTIALDPKMPTVKILHVYKEFHPEGSGVARHIDGLLRALALRGTAGMVFAPDLAANLGPAPYEIVSGGHRALERAIAGASVVHVHGARTPIALFAAWRARRARKPVFYTPHCYYDSATIFKRLAKYLWDQTGERWLLRAARVTILLDPIWMQDLARRGLTPARTAYVPNCILRSAVESRRRPPCPPETGQGQPMLLSVGRLDPVKRLCDAVQILASPGLEGAVLHLVGTGPDEARLRQVAAAVGVGDRVRWHGRLPDADVAELLAQADVFLLPSAREGGPTALLEALWLGVPVIAAHSLGTDAMAACLGWSGLVPVGDRAALAAAVRAPPLVTPVIQQRLSEIFTWEARIEEVWHLYRTACDS